MVSMYRRGSLADYFDERNLMCDYYEWYLSASIWKKRRIPLSGGENQADTGEKENYAR